MCLAQGPQRSDPGEARTRGLLVSSQALYHCAPILVDKMISEINKLGQAESDQTRLDIRNKKKPEDFLGIIRINSLSKFENSIFYSKNHRCIHKGLSGPKTSYQLKSHNCANIS